MDQLQLLYESEINWQISGLYDEGFAWKLGDEKNGWKAMGTANTNSEFALMHRGPLN